MAVPAGGSPTLVLSGDVAFVAGGLPVTALTGAVVKAAAVVGTDLSITAQLADGTETTVTFAGGGGGGAGLTAEQVRDTIAAIMTAGDGVTIAYVDDGDNAGTITIAATGGFSIAADFPATADAEAGVLYGDGTPVPDIIGYLKRIGETHESTFRTAFLGRGFYGFADAGRDFGGTKYRAGGEVSPRPGGLLAVAFHVASQTRNTMFVDVSTSSGLFHPEMTSLEIVITQEDSTVQTHLLDQVSTPEAGVRRFLASVTVPSGGMLYEAGEHNRISVKLSAFATPIDLHGGTDVVEVVDEFSIEAQRAEIHREIAAVDERVEENEEDIAALQGRHSSKSVTFDMLIAAGAAATDNAGFHGESNIWRVNRDCSISGFSHWVEPDIGTTYRGHWQKLVKNTDEDYSLVAPWLDSDVILAAPGSATLELVFAFSDAIELKKGDYVLVGVHAGAAAFSRQQADAPITEFTDVLDYVTHSKIDGTPGINANLWHENPNNQAYRQRLRVTAASHEELVVRKEDIPVYSGPAVLDFSGDVDAVEIGTDKILIRLHPDRVIVSEDDPPDPDDVVEGDRAKLYIQTNADGHILDVSYVRVVDPHDFTLSSTQFTDGGETKRGFKLDGNHGHLSPLLNIVQIDHGTTGVPFLDTRFDVASQDPIDYTTLTHLTLYTRRKGSGGSWTHHVLIRQTDHHQFTTANVSTGYLGDDVRYEMILREGNHGSGTGLVTVPAGNRIEAYPGGLKREVLPSFNDLDNLTRLYDIIREVVTGATDFVGLSDTPAALGTAGQAVVVNTARDALVFADAGGGTTVVANPAGTDGDDLSRVSIAGTNYVIPEGGGGTDPEVLYDNHPTLVEIGTLNANLASASTSFALTAAPTETVTADDFFLINSEVLDIAGVSGSTISATRGQRGTAGAIHLAGTPVYLLTVANGGLGRTFTTQEWEYSSANQNAVDLGKALTEANDDGKEAYIEIEYDAAGVRRYGEIVIDSRTIRDLVSLPRISTSLTHETFALVMQRADVTGLVSNAPMFVHFGRKRFNATDATNFNVTSGNDGLRIAVAASGAAIVLYRVYMRIRLIDPAGGGASGQSADADATTGTTRKRLYQREDIGTTPGDPTDSWDGSAFVTDFGDWHEDIDDVPAGTGVIWVANGGSVLVGVTRTNLGWQVYPTVAQQYCTVRQDNNTYTDAYETDSLWERDVTATGFTPWRPLYAGNAEGWTTLIEAENCWVDAPATDTLGYDFTEVDCENFREIELELAVYSGILAPTTLASVTQFAYKRRGGANWTSKTTDSDGDIKLGFFKVRYSDVNGLEVVTAGGTALSTNQTNSLAGSGGAAWRRFGFNVNLIASTGVGNINNLRRIFLDNFTGAVTFSRITVRVRQ